MLCKDSGIMPKGDYENIQSLFSRKFIDAELSNSLSRCNGLRNILVHRYNGIDASIVLRSIQNVKVTFTRFIELLEGYLGES